MFKLDYLKLAGITNELQDKSETFLIEQIAEPIDNLYFALGIHSKEATREIVSIEWEVMGSAIGVDMVSEGLEDGLRVDLEPNTISEFKLKLPEFQIPQEGEYQFTLWVNGGLFASTSLIIRTY